MFWKQYKIHILGTLGDVHTFISCFEKTAGAAVKYAPHLRKQGTKRGTGLNLHVSFFASIEVAYELGGVHKYIN